MKTWNMKNLLIIILITIGIFQGIFNNKQQPKSNNTNFTQTNAQSNNHESLTQAYTNHQSNVQVRGLGKVIRILPDDKSGAKHQKFILRIDSGQKILIAHNTDLAGRINAISNNDQVEFYGEYEWNKKGGVVHWTHKDPSGKHVSGWLKHNGRTYE